MSEVLRMLMEDFTQNSGVKMSRAISFSLIALASACSENASVDAERDGKLGVKDLEGQHILVFTPDKNSESKGISISTSPLGGTEPVKYDLEIASRDGQISGCTVTKAEAIDESARCNLENGRLVIRLGTDRVGLMYVLGRETSAISGDAYFRSSAVPGGSLKIGMAKLES